jgi:hypothetical protein
MGIAVVIVLATAAGWFLLRGRDGTKARGAANPADMGKELRRMALTLPADKIGFRPDDDYPKVYGVLVDWNLDDQTVSILAMRDGTASVYTTARFGLIGGQGHAKVRTAAEACTRVAARYHDQGVPVTDFPYPTQGKVNFYLLSYEGVRLSVGDEAAINRGTDPTLPLFAAAQEILTELRLAGELGRD